jgi:hypothetical protein
MDPQYNVFMKNYIKDTIYTVVVFYLLYAGGYPQRWAPLAHVAVSLVPPGYRRSQEGDVWLPTGLLCLCAGVVLSDAWLALSHACTSFGSNCCSAGARAPPFGLGLPLCDAQAETLFGIVSVLYIFACVAAALNVMHIMGLLVQMRPAASLPVALAASYGALKVWLLTWGTPRPSAGALVVDAATVGAALFGVYLTTFRPANKRAPLLSLGACLVLDVMLASGLPAGPPGATAFADAAWRAAHGFGVPILVGLAGAAWCRPLPAPKARMEKQLSAVPEMRGTSTGDPPLVTVGPRPRFGFNL